MKSGLAALADQTELVEERNALEREIADLEISQAKLIEDNDRKLRDTTHKVGLLQEKQKQDAEHAEAGDRAGAAGGEAGGPRAEPGSRNR